MPKVTILSREETARSLEPGRFELTVAVTYSSAAVSPRILVLPRAVYRPATAAELAKAPRLLLLPTDVKAAQAERDAIVADLSTIVSGPISAWEF